MSRGIQRERAVATVLRKLGYLVASLRHEFGAGDLLAIAPLDRSKSLDSVWPLHRTLLVEVKGTLEVPWSAGGGCFGSEERKIMLAAEARWNVEPILAWWPPHLVGGPIWIPAEDWPA